MKNVLVVGGAGYIGGYVTDRLQGEYNVTVYDGLLYERQYLKPVPFLKADVRDRLKLQEALDWADIVVWLAAVVGDAACDIRPDATRAVNVEAVRYLSENFEGRIIFPSTCSVYGAQDELLDEDSPTNPLSLYAATKLQAEGLLADKNAMIFRLGTLFGMGDAYARLRFDLVVNLFVAKAYLGEPVTVYGGDQWRPLLHVRDVAEAVVAALEAPTTGIYNLSQSNYQIKTLINSIRDDIAPDLHVEWAEMDKVDARNYRVRADRVREALQLPHKRQLQDGIRELWTFLNEGRIKNVYDPTYHNYQYLSTTNWAYEGGIEANV